MQVGRRGADVRVAGCVADFGGRPAAGEACGTKPRPPQRIDGIAGRLASQRPRGSGTTVKNRKGAFDLFDERPPERRPDDAAEGQAGTGLAISRGSRRNERVAGRATTRVQGRSFAVDEEEEFERLRLKAVEHHLETVGGRDYRGAEWSVTRHCQRCGRRRIRFDEATEAALAGGRARAYYFAYPRYDHESAEAGFQGYFCKRCPEQVDWVREGF